MIYTLKKIRKQNTWSGLSRYSSAFLGLTPELGRDGLIVTGMTTKEAREMEALLFMKKGKLAPDSKYWIDFQIPVPETGLSLDEDIPQHKLYLYILKAMKKVASSQAQLKEKSKADYILTSPIALEVEEDDRLSIKEEAYEELIGSSPAKQKQIYVVLEASKHRNARILDADSMTEKAIKNGLRTAIEANAKSFNIIAADPKLHIKYTILNLVTKGILSTANGAYLHNSEQLAYDLDSMVQFMENPHNQPKVIQFNQLLYGQASTQERVEQVKSKGGRPKKVELEREVNEVSPD